MKTKPTLTVHDLGSYLAAFWILLKLNRLPTGTDFHQTLARTFNEEKVALEAHFRIVFRIQPHFIHNDSQSINDMFAGIVSRGLGHYLLPTDGFLHLDLKKEEAKTLTKDLPAEVRRILNLIATKAVNAQLAT